MGWLLLAAVFSGAKWMWPTELGCATNTVVEFRQELVSERAGAAKLTITADEAYRVALNGELVFAGRLPDVPPERFYDTIDLRLAKGTNELLVSVFSQGVETSRNMPGDPGVMYSLIGDGVAARSGAGVQTRICAAHRRDGVPSVSGQLGLSFEYDAAAKENEWKRIGEDDARRGEEAFTLRPRPIPRVEILPEVEARVVGQGALDGSPLHSRPAKGMDEAVLRPVSAERFFGEDGKSVGAEFFKDGFFITVDLGREEAGLLSMDIDTDAGVVVDVGHAEHIEDGKIRTAIGKRNFAGRYRAREGRQQFCRWEQRMAGRYLQIHVRGARRRFVLHRLSVKPTLLPLTERPEPAGLSARQSAIYRTAMRTIRLCMHEHFEDCPWREQALYANDSRNQMLCGYHCFGDDWKMPEHAMWLMSRGLREDGWIRMCMPTRMKRTIPSFTFCWVLSVDDYLRHRRNLEFVREMMPTVKQILDRRVGEMREGLLPCPTGEHNWHFYDWADGMDGYDRVPEGTVRFESPLNMFFILALETGVRCAEATGNNASAAVWREAADTVRRQVSRRFWNADKRQMETAEDAKCAAELTQALALLSRTVPDGAVAAVAHKLSAPSEWTTATLSQSLYKYEAVIACGTEADKQAVAAEIDTVWGEMLDAGATSFWEMREGWKAFGTAGSLCHGWSAIPIYFYNRLFRNE